MQKKPQLCRGHQPSGIAPPSTIFKETVRKPRIRQAPKPVTTVCSQHVIKKKKKNQFLERQKTGKNSLQCPTVCAEEQAEKNNPQQNIFALEVVDRKRGREGSPQNHLSPEPSRLSFVQGWIGSTPPAPQESSDASTVCFILASPSREDAQPPCIASQGLHPSTLWNQIKLTTSNCLLWDFLLANKILKNNKYFPTSAIWVKYNRVTETRVKHDLSFSIY